MKTRTTLILFIIVLAVAAYIRFYERHQPNTAEAQRRSQNVINFDRDKIDGITIQSGDDRIDLRLENKKWRIESPVKDQADGNAISMLLSDLDTWQKFDTISAREIDADKNKLSEFGVGKPKLRIKLLGKDAPPEILIGKDAALEGKVYVRLENSKEVFLAAKNVRDDISKKPEEFRDKKLTDLTTTQLNRVILKTNAGEMELQKTGEHWDIVKPLRARADDQKVGDFIAQVTTARIEKFIGQDNGDLHPYGLAEPRGTVTLFSPDVKEGQTLAVGTAVPNEKEQVYVRFAARGSVYTLPKKIEELLNTKPADLRDRHLVRIDPNQLDRVTIDVPGKAKTVLARKGESWTIASRKDQPANSSEVMRLIDLLKTEQVKRFVEDVASDLPKYALDKPQLQVTLSSFASENTAETKAGEKPLATISFGRVEGDVVYARNNDEPFIVAVDKNLLGQIFTDPLQWQELAIFKAKPEQVHRLTVVTDKEQSITRGANNEWTWTAGGSGAINTTNVQSLLNTLTNLHAVRWVGGTVPGQAAFDKPQLVVTFTTSPDDKQLHKLLVGGPAGDGMWLAKTDEHEGVFVINNPDLNALKLPIAGAPPTPEPTASATATATP
ncbi:MAG: DUF4340 domain-containing protein [Chthoniobacterales bacterium]